MAATRLEFLDASMHPIGTGPLRFVALFLPSAAAYLPHHPTDMPKPLLAALPVVVLLNSAASLYGQTLLLQYTFDDATSPAADTGAVPAAPAAIVTGGSASGFVAGNSPSGSGSVFTTGDGNNNYLTTGAAGDPDGVIGDIAKLDNLQAFTLTVWVNLQTVAVNDRFMSDGGAPGLTIDGFDFLIAGPSSGTISASNFRLTLAVDRTSVNATPNTGALNQWVFFAVTYDGTLTSNNVVFYRGTTSTSASQLGSTLTLNNGPVNENNLPFQVAGTAQTPNDRSPAGLYDDVRVYSGAADAAFIEGIRLANIPEPSSSTAVLCGTLLLGLIRRRAA
jgi:hypothetical protein